MVFVGIKNKERFCGIWGGLHSNTKIQLRILCLYHLFLYMKKEIHPRHTTRKCPRTQIHYVLDPPTVRAQKNHSQKRVTPFKVLYTKLLYQFFRFVLSFLLFLEYSNILWLSHQIHAKTFLLRHLLYLFASQTKT